MERRTLNIKKIKISKIPEKAKKLANTFESEQRKTAALSNLQTERRVQSTIDNIDTLDEGLWVNAITPGKMKKTN